MVEDLPRLLRAGDADPEWSLVFEGADPANEGLREALCTLGNGYFATRASAVWAQADGVHYPGTYLAGGYNRLQTVIAGRTVENEDLVNLPNWLVLQFKIADDDWFDTAHVSILSYRQELDLQRGLLLTAMRFEDQNARRTLLRERRLVSMANMHLGAIQMTLTAENWSGPVTVRSAIDGRIVNAGAKLYRKFNNKHLVPSPGRVIGEDCVALQVRTSQSDVLVAQVARTQVFHDGQLIETSRPSIEKPGFIGQDLAAGVKQDESLMIEKLAVLYTSRDRAISEAGLAARTAMGRAARYGDIEAEHTAVWRDLWRRFDVQIVAAERGIKLNIAMLLRLNMFHLLQTVSIHSIGLDVGIPPRGWTGEAYQGHIFWDELFIFPFFNFRLPEMTRAILTYRYRRLGEARAAARAIGQRGAMFPWQSGSDGQEETEKLNLNPHSQRWVPDNSYLQRHVGSAIAYNVWQYFQVTRDTEFLQFYGAELMLEIALFWSGMAILNSEKGRYEILGVMGPDEFHDGYPDVATPGVNNNAYTNVMAVWVLCRALDALERMPKTRRDELRERLGISPAEIARWDDVSRRMFVPFQEGGIISQFEGYESLRELDWAAYRARYADIQRLDLILEAEGDSANRYKLSKQADVVMLFYLFSADELGALFARLGYTFNPATIPDNIAYYVARTSFGSTLCRVVYSWVLARSDRPRSMAFFADALQSDVGDSQHGTSAEGIHLGAMAGTVDQVLRVTTGIEVKDGVLLFNPELPPEMACLESRIRYRGHSLDLRLTNEVFTVSGNELDAAPIVVSVNGTVHDFISGSARVFRLDGRAGKPA